MKIALTSWLALTVNEALPLLASLGLAGWLTKDTAPRARVGKELTSLTTYGNSFDSVTETVPAGTSIGPLQESTATLTVPTVAPSALIVNGNEPATQSSAACLQTSM